MSRASIGRASHNRLLEMSSASVRGAKVVIATINFRPRMVAESKWRNRKNLKKEEDALVKEFGGS